uniref:FERM and PDZ domain containing 2 n=1 Tax=Molossus molossus TaxID=27622 RepID=A0A7J8DNX4_MOLMO|nr:FERM and PDZ domain containing 2 [Molossus molossus]
MLIPLVHEQGMSPASVALASALQARTKLCQEEIWSLWFLAAQRLLEDLSEGSSDYVVCPWSTLLSVFGSVSFQGHVSHAEAARLKAPGRLQQQSSKSSPVQLG